MKTWIWIAAAGAGAAYYYYRQKKAKEPLLVEEEYPPEELPGELYPAEELEGVIGVPTDQTILLQRMARKLLKVASARMPFMPPMIPPKTMTRSVIDQIIIDLSDQFDACFGVRQWEDFILAPFMSKAQFAGVSRMSTDAQRLVYLEAFISFFDEETQALRNFLICMKAEHGDFRHVEEFGFVTDPLARPELGTPGLVEKEEEDGSTSAAERGWGLTR